MALPRNIASCRVLWHRMGFFLGLIGYLTAVALMIGGALFSALWVARPLPPPHEGSVVVTDPAKRLHGANAALTAHPKTRHLKQKQHASKRR